MWKNTLLRYARAAAEVFFPRRCIVCGELLNESEQWLCASCLTQLPLTRLKGGRGNVVERIFYDIPGTQRGNAFLLYRSENIAYTLIHKLKYGDRPAIGETVGQWIAHDLADGDFFKGIDALVPVPLSAQKQLKRGFNQSETVARGIAKVTGIPIRSDLAVRTVNNPTQTALNTEERRKNVDSIFAIPHPEKVTELRKSPTAPPPHLLLIDDVITTGATLRSLGKTFAAACDVRLSYLSIALAGHHLNLFEEGAT